MTKNGQNGKFGRGGGFCTGWWFSANGDEPKTE
jgi:hypothetical protein